MADTYFVGLRGTTDLVSNEMADNWRAGILRLFPNGMAPLTALTALMPSRKLTEGPHYHWWTKTLNTQRASTTLYTDASVASAYASGGVAGTVLYAKVSAAAVVLFRAGQQVLMRDASNYAADITGKVVSTLVNGASSVVGIKLLEADTSTLLAGCDTLLVIGSVNPQAGTRPEALTQGPTEFSSYTQIFRDALDLSRTLLETRLRTEDPYTEAKRDALELHMIGIEKALLWGVQYLGTGSNGKPEYTTNGLLYWIKTYGTIEDYSLDDDTKYAGKAWNVGGEEWLDEHLEEIFRYGGNERLAFCGSGALLGIQRLVKANAQYNIQAREAAYGIKVLEWITPFGSIMLKTHPLFSYEATNRNSMLLFEPKNLKYNYITDTMFTPDVLYGKGGGTGYDGKQEEYLTECGLEMYFPETCGYLNGIGVDNAVGA